MILPEELDILNATNLVVISAISALSCLNFDIDMNLQIFSNISNMVKIAAGGCKYWKKCHTSDSGG